MAHATYWYAKGLQKVLDGTVDLDDDTIKCSLMTDGYTPDYAADEFMDESGANDPIDEELNYGGGDTYGYYAGHGHSGRKTLTVALSVISGPYVKMDADDQTWSTLNAALDDIKAAIIHTEGTANDTDAALLLYIAFDPVFDPNGSDFNLALHTDGICYFAAGAV